MKSEAETRPTGKLGLRVVRALQDGPEETLYRRGTGPQAHIERLNIGSGPRYGRPLTALEILEHGFPQKGLPEEVNEWRHDNARNLFRGMRHQLRARRIARRHNLPHFWSQLYLAKIGPDGARLELGLAGMRVVTTAGVGFIVDAFQNSVELELMNFHGIGTTNTAEAVGDTALAAEITTQYNPDNTRATGTQGENGANVYQTVGTNTVDATVAAVEHGVLSQAATGGGVLLDRTVFTVVNLASADSLESTYELTVTAGG